MVKSFIFTALVVISMASAKVITHIESFPMVKVKAPAKSEMIYCKTRVDLDEGLIDNTKGCDISEVKVLNKSGMWIGDLEAISAGASANYQEYDEDRYRGKGYGVKIIYDVQTESADYINGGYVTCPTGMYKYIEDEFYKCRPFFQCPKGMYASDSTECSVLPDNAHRNATDGYECNAGYIFNSLDQCIKKLNCKGNQLFDAELGECIDLPLNAHWTDKESHSWECNENYVQVYYACEVMAKCNEFTEKYNSTDNTCVERPLHSHWMYPYDNNNFEWMCDDAYIQNGNRCDERAKCSADQFYHYASNSCLSPYPHSTFVSEFGLLKYTCNDGYFDTSNGLYDARIVNPCEPRKTCQHYNPSDNTCYTKPNNAHWTSTDGASWECDAGLHINPYNPNECVSCGKDEKYNPYTEQCLSKPSNAQWLSEYGEWVCNDGYIRTDDHCDKVASCGFFERRNEEYNTCISKPSHASWIGNTSYYECDDGYYDDNAGNCVQYENSSYNSSYYSNIERQFTLEATYGGLNTETDESDAVPTSAAKIGLGYNIGYHTDDNSFTLSMLTSASYMYASDTISSVHLVQLQLGIGISFGSPTFHFYLMPFANVNIGLATTYNADNHPKYDALMQHYDKYNTEQDVVNGTGGLEIGLKMMYWDNNQLCIFMRIEQTPFTFGSVQKYDSFVSIGARLLW